MPDRTILLTLVPERGVSRATARDGAGADRFVVRDPAFHARVAAVFDRIAAAEPGRVRRLDADREPAEVTAAILAELGDLLT